MEQNSGSGEHSWEVEVEPSHQTLNYKVFYLVELREELRVAFLGFQLELD